MLFYAKYGNATICGCKITSILSNYQVFLQLFALKCSFYGFCSIFKPQFLLFIKERRQFFINQLMIIIEPFNLFRQQHINIYWSGIYRAKCKRLYLQEFTELSRQVVRNQHRIFYSYAELTCQIQSRLISQGHSSSQRCRHPFHSNLMRAFMHTEIRTYSMSCTMQEIRQPRLIAG